MTTERTAPGAAPALDEAALGWSVFRLAWPVVVQQVSFSIEQLVDAVLVGRLGEDALAGVRLASQLFWLAMAGMTAVGVGTIALVARNFGAGQPERAAAVLRSALLLALAWGGAIGLGFWALGAWALTMMGAEPEAGRLGAHYLRSAALAMPFWSLLFAVYASLQGAGDTRTPMAIGVAVNVVHIVLSTLLVNGVGPFPRLGVTGAGAGFTVAVIAGALAALLLLSSGRLALRWSPWMALAVDRRELSRILRIGVPTGLEQAQFNIAFMLYTRTIASLGTTAVAAHGITLAIQSLTYNAGSGLSVAASALVGQGLGAQRPDLAQRAAYLATRYALALMGLVAVVLLVFGGEITGLFVAGEEADRVVETGRRLMIIFAFAMPGMGVSLALGGALRGAGDTRAVLFIMAFCAWVIRLLPAYLLAITAGLGVPGAWTAAVLDIDIRALLIWLRFRQGRWRHIRV